MRQKPDQLFVVGARRNMILAVKYGASIEPFERILDCEVLQDCRIVATTTFMKQFLVLVLMVLTSWSSIWANLGDSDDKIEDSYGAIIERHLLDNGTVSVVYHKDRYLYKVTFAGRKSVSEMYSHVKGTDLSEKEIARFLKANAGAATWTPDDKTKERRFERSDRKAEATYSKINDRPTLTVRELHRSTPEIKN